MKCIVLFLVIFLSLSAFVHPADDSFSSQIVSQPVKLKDNALLSEDETASLISSEGTASRELMDSVYDDLTSGYRVADMDVDPKRIVLLLETTDGAIIRIAQWNEKEKAYVITDWRDLPNNVFLDTYHDGDAVLFECFDESVADSESAVLITIEESDGLWHVTSFTDAMTYSAEKTNTGYMFCDYWEYEAEEYQWHFESPTQMGKVTWMHLLEMINEYNTLFPLRPAMDEGYWDEVDG